MLYDAADEPAALDRSGLLAAYGRELAAVVGSEGVETVAESTGIERERLAALGDRSADGDPDGEGVATDGTAGDDAAADAPTADDADPAAGLTLEEAAAVLAVSAEYPDAEAVVMEVRDHLLLSMTTGVVDVDTVAANVDLDLTGQEVQQAIEGRNPMTLDELAAIQAYLEARNDRDA